MKRSLTICTVLGLICILSGYTQAEWYIIQFSEEDLWNHTPSSDTRLYDQDAPRRHHTNWKADIQTTDSTQPDQSVYQTTTGTNGWFQKDTYDNWLSAGPKDNSDNDFGICEVQLWGAGYPNSRLAFNERFRVNGGAEAWVILATPAGWTSAIEDNQWDDNGTGPLDQYWAVWRANEYANRILYSTSGDGIDDYVFMFAVDIVGEYATTLEPSPDGNPLEDDGSLRFWFGGIVLNSDNTWTNEGYDGVITTTTSDPTGGFVTGGGTIWSEADPEAAFMSEAGQASFGFVAKYKKGANVPDGNTNFVFEAGELHFHSSDYDWLVAAGKTAKFKGTGTIDGLGDDFKFMLWAGDNDPDVDTFRILIWQGTEEEPEVLIYDNGPNDPLTGGSIIIHKEKGK